MPARIAIIGTGLVGSSFAFALMQTGMASEIVLIDVDHMKAEGDAMDLNHGLAYASPARIWAGSYDECGEADIIVIAAGVNQKQGETRLDLVKRNTEIFRDIVGQLRRVGTDGIIIVATNPVDILTYATVKFSGFRSQRVIGSGTILDTARFRFLLGEYLAVDPRSVHAYIIGEHGDSEVPVWSLANVAGIPLAKACETLHKGYGSQVREDIFGQVRDAAYEIIRRKGATHYAIALGLIRIVQAVLGDQKSILTVSTLLDGYQGVEDICLGVPAIIGHSGVQRVIDLPLDENERSGFADSGRILREIAASVGLGSN